MAKFDYNKTLATSKRLITKFGNTVKLVRDADLNLWERIYDPVSEDFQWKNRVSGQVVDTKPPDEEYSGDGVIVGIEDNLLQNKLVKSSDKVILIIGIPEPTTGDTFYAYDGVAYSYVMHEKVNPAGIALLYKIVVRI